MILICSQDWETLHLTPHQDDYKDWYTDDDTLLADYTEELGHMIAWKEYKVWIQTGPAQPLPKWVTSAKLPSCPESQFPHLQIEDNSNYWGVWGDTILHMTSSVLSCPPEPSPGKRGGQTPGWSHNSHSLVFIPCKMLSPWVYVGPVTSF